MPERNPPMGVRIHLTPELAQQNELLLDILADAGTIKPTYTLDGQAVKDFTLVPPKHVTNNKFWADRVARFVTQHNIPALVVRL